MDLNSALGGSQAEDAGRGSAVRRASIRYFLREAIVRKGWERIFCELEQIRIAVSLDVLILTDESGVVVAGARNPKSLGYSQADDPATARFLNTQRVLSLNCHGV